MREGSMVQVKNDEIDLVDLFKILYKNRIMIMVITAVVTLVSLGGALYVRSHTKNLIAVNFRRVNRIDPFYIKKANLGVNQVEIENIFKQNSVVEEIYKVPYLNEMFLETEAPDNINERRKFLEKTVKLEDVMEDKKLKYYQLSMESNGEVQGERRVMDTYLNILSEKLSDAYTTRIDEGYELVKEKREGYEGELSKIEAEVNEVISREPKELFENEKAWDIIQAKHPRLFERQRKMRELYVKYGDELVGIEGIKGDFNLNNQVTKISSFYEVKQKSKAKLIVVIGVVMGVILGVMGAFIKEFWEHLKREIAEG